MELNKEKQIDEIAKLICTYPQCIHYNIIGECKISECQTVDIAEVLYNAGYRKASDVAREIFEELNKAMIDEFIYPIIAELKKKYIGEDINVTTNTEEGK